jgi:hypothetical protein
MVEKDEDMAIEIDLARMVLMKALKYLKHVIISNGMMIHGLGKRMASRLTTGAHVLTL